MSTIPLDDEAKHLHPLSKHLRKFVLWGIIPAVVAVLAFNVPFGNEKDDRCKPHEGGFSNGFSADFDVSRLDCRTGKSKLMPTIQILGVAPYVRLVW